MTYPKIFNSDTGQWTSLFTDSVNLETIDGIDVENPLNEQLLIYKTASNGFVNQDINSYLENKSISVRAVNIAETLIVNGELITSGGGGSGSVTVTTEQIQDAAAPLIAHEFHNDITATYDDENDRIVLTGTPATTTEEIQDAVAPLFVHENHSNIAATYDDESNQVILSASVDFNVTTEEIQDAAATLFIHSDHNNIEATYDDDNNKIILSASVDLNVTTEEIQDAAAPLLDHNFHTNITVTYDDANNRILLTGSAAGGGSGSAAPITNFYDIVRDFEAVAEEEDSRAKIQNALNAARDAGGGIVYIPNGLWNISGGLRIYSNTNLTLSPKAYIRKLFAGGSMLWNGDNGASYPEYSGQRNITISGGIWDARATAFLTTPANIYSFAHSQNLTIRDITFLNVGGYHAIEINSTKNAFVENCRFLGFLDTGDRSFSEAIQIDGAFRQNVFGEFGAYDKTICSDVTVSRCYFGPSTVPNVAEEEALPAWPTGVGSHSADTSGSTLLSDVKHLNTKIINNTFENLTEYAVRTDGVHRECLIANNMFINCSGGVGLGFKTRNLNESWQTSFNITISNNIFQFSINSARDCIFARNIDGLVISNNQIRFTGKSGIRVTDCNEALISSNRFEFIREHGILIENCDDSIVDHNIFRNISTSANNTFSYIIYKNSPSNCSTIGNRGNKASTANVALFGLRIENGTGMRSYGNRFGANATTPYQDNSTAPVTATTNS
jgi:hypothetical protein